MIGPLMRYMEVMMKIVKMRSPLILLLFNLPQQPLQLIFTIGCVHSYLHVPLFTTLMHLACYILKILFKLYRPLRKSFVIVIKVLISCVVSSI